MGQFSKYVDAEAVYLTTTGSYIYPDGTGVQAVALRNGGTSGSGERVVVIQNKIRSELPVQLSLNNGETWHATVPARSLTTWVLPPSAQ
jgi:glucosylceramidase